MLGALRQTTTLLTLSLAIGCASEPKTKYNTPRTVSDDLTGRIVECGAKASFALVDPSYVVEIKPLIDAKCIGCHPAVAPPGLTNYTLVKDNVVAVLDEVNGDRMPPGNPLSPEEKALLQAWLDAGTPELAVVDPTPTPAPTTAPAPGDEVPGEEENPEEATSDPAEASGAAGGSTSYAGKACSNSGIDPEVCLGEGGLPVEGLCFRDVFECDHEKILDAFSVQGIDINPRMPANYEIDGCAYMKYSDGSLSGKIPIVAIRFTNSDGETIRRVLTVD